MLHTSSNPLNNGGIVSTTDQTIEKHCVNENGEQQTLVTSKIPPSATFERTSFDQLLCQYDLKHDLPPTIELTQAFLLTQNMKETASRVNGLTAGGSAYFLKNEYVGDTLRLSDAM